MKFTPSQSTSVRIAGAVLLAAAAALPIRADYPSTVLSQSPVGYWRLNETITPANTTTTANFGSLGSSAAGTYNGFAPGGNTGPFVGSTAVSLDGAVQSVTTPYQAGLNPSSFTIEAWVNPVSAAVSGGLLCVASSVHAGSPRSGWLIYQSDGTAAGSPAGTGYLLRVYNQNGTSFSLQLLAPQTVVAGTWTHVAFTFNGATATAYINGAQVSTGTAPAFVANVDSAFSVGVRSDNGFFWPGEAAEVAYYNTVLTGTRIAAHYTVATSTPANYQTTVLGDSPILYWRFAESSFPPAVNSGTLGTAGNGFYVYDTTAGQPGPSNPPFTGFEAANKAPTFSGPSGAGGVVHLPALNLNNNNVTISCWVKASGSQATSAGIVVNGSGTGASGLTIDPISGGLGLGALWGGSTFGWSPTTDSGLPPLVDSTWCYAALVIQPTEATLYICDSNNFGNWATASYIGVVNANEAFSAATTIGGEAGSTPTLNFNGSIDEVAIFNRALGQGELYTDYANGVGGVPPKIFTDIQGPSAPVAAGDPIVLAIDAGGTTPTYTWHKNGGTVGTTSTGTFTIATSQLSDAGNYDVTISGVGTPAQSATIAVSVITPTQPTIVGTQGFFNRTLYPTGTLAMAVSATGGGVKYQWYKNASPIASATASAYTIPHVTTANAGSYSVSVTNSVGVASNGPVAITIPTPTPGSYAALVVAGGPEAWWRLDETSGTNMFDGMGRHDGTYTNANGGVAPLPTFGVPGIADGGDTAVTFNRNGGIGIVPYSADLNSSVTYTYEAWVKTTDLSTFQVPFSSVDANGGKWFAMVTGTTPVTWEPGATGGYYDLWNGDPVPHSWSTLPVASGVWTHLVIIYNPAANATFPWQFYVNGVTDGYIWSLPPNAINGSAPFAIGCAVTTSPQAGTFFNGQVDEVAVYKRALGSTEIVNHFNTGFPPTPPSFSTPFLSQTVTLGKSVSFSTTAQGTTPITLQWYKGSTPIAGQTNGTFSIASVAQSDSATYTLWATNAAGVASQSATLTVILPVPYANFTNGLVLHLKMDGNTTDSSGRGNNGTPVGGPTFVAGQIGQGLNTVTTVVTNNGTNLVFNSASYVVLGSLADLQFGASTSWSASMWVKLATGSMPVDIPFIGTATNSNGSLGWDMSPGYENGGYQWTMNDGVINMNVTGPGGTINDGLWHYFALVVDRAGHTASTYFDGLMVAANDISTLGSVDGGGFVVIAQDPTETYNPTGSPFSAADGAAFPSSISLDDIGVWRRALSALEVAKIQSAGVGGHSFDLPAPPVTITVTRSGGNVTLNWATGTLLQSTSLGAGASWVPVTGAAAPSYTFTPTGAAKFFRVITQ